MKATDLLEKAFIELSHSTPEEVQHKMVELGISVPKMINANYTNYFVFDLGGLFTDVLNSTNSRSWVDVSPPESRKPVLVDNDNKGFIFETLSFSKFSVYA